ncbi:MAG: sulfotransferase, partial [Proteobacteria bacterium]|nr:sulfotransferase [Pseudomonadota bacterium]
MTKKQKGRGGAELVIARQLREAEELGRAEALCQRFLPPLDGDTVSDPIQIGFMALLGLIRLQHGDRESGNLLVKTANRSAQGTLDPEIDLDLSGGLLLLGDLQGAADLLERARVKKPTSGILHYRLGLLAMGKGEIDQALENFSRAVDFDPDRAIFHLSLARTFFLTKNKAKADEHVWLAEAVAPDLRLNPSPQYADLLLDLGRGEALVDLLRPLLDQQPVSSSKLLCGADLAVKAGQSDLAEAFLRRAKRVDSENIHVLTQLAGFLQARGKHREAVGVLRSAIRIDPDNLFLWIQVSEVAYILSHLPLIQKASNEIHRLFDMAPEEVKQDKRLISQVHTCEGFARIAQGQAKEAELDFSRALAEDPDNGQAAMGKGTALMVQGKINQASAVWSGLAQTHSEIGNAVLISQARTLPEDPDALSQMVQKAGAQGISEQMRQALLFAIGMAHEKMGDHNKAFASIREANGLERKTIHYNPDDQSRFIAQMQEVFTPGFYLTRKSHGLPTRMPIFVVGPPRSGTSLVEQVLSSHSLVHGAGELSLIPHIARTITALSGQREKGAVYPKGCMSVTRSECRRMADFYLTTVKQYDSHALHIIDKLPHNFMHLGLIHLLFPRALIINCRRDPRDVAISNYFIQFQNKDEGMAFAYDLRDIGRLLCDYHHIMNHWHQVMPGRIFDIQYEKLVENPESNLRELLEFCGLNWEESVLNHQKNKRNVRTASLWQVRQP